MKNFSNYEGYLIGVLTKIMYVVALNLLFLLCSLPIVTIGAASTAMYTVMLKFLQEDEPYIIKSFFTAFKENFKKSTLVWLAMLAVLGTLGMNYYLLYNSSWTGTGAIRVLLNLVLVMWSMLWVYIFPSIAYFENSIKGYISFTTVLALAKLPYTVVLVVLQTVPVILVLFLAQFIPMATLLFICCGISLPAYFSGMLLLKLFKHFGDGVNNEKME